MNFQVQCTEKPGCCLDMRTAPTSIKNLVWITQTNFFGPMLCQLKPPNAPGLGTKKVFKRVRGSLRKLLILNKERKLTLANFSHLIFHEVRIWLNSSASWLSRKIVLLLPPLPPPLQGYQKRRHAQTRPFEKIRLGGTFETKLIKSIGVTSWENKIGPQNHWFK